MKAHGPICRVMDVKGKLLGVVGGQLMDVLVDQQFPLTVQRSPAGPMVRTLDDTQSTCLKSSSTEATPVTSTGTSPSVMTPSPKGQLIVQNM